jgi:hypothetical protein
MRNLHRIFPAFLFACLSLGRAGPGRACDEYVCAPQDPFRATVTHGNFTNLYFYPDPDAETWDQHLAKAGHPELSIASIDAVVTGLVSSSYFYLASQYHEIEPPTFSGHQTTASACTQPVVQYANANNNLLSYAILGDFVACEVNAGGNKSDQVNVILSPEYTAQNDVSFKLPTGQTITFAHPGIACGLGSDTGAFHTSKLGAPNFVVDPTSCHLSLDLIAESLSHEMLETISDPAGAGYVYIPGGKDQFLAAVTDWSVYENGELADICEPGGPQNPNDDDNLAYLPFPFATYVPAAGYNAQLMKGLHVSRYWSNIDNSCQPQFLMSDKLVDDTSPPRMGTGGGMTSQVQYFAPFTKYSTLDPSMQSQRGIDQLMLYTHTNNDNLCNESDLSVTIDFAGHAPVLLDHLNQVQNADSWNNGEVHAVNLAVPSGMTLGDLVAITVSDNSGHCKTTGIPDTGLDGWNPDHIVIFAALDPPPEPNNGATPVLTLQIPETLFKPTLATPQSQLTPGQSLAIKGLNFPTTPSKAVFLLWTANVSGMLTSSNIQGLPPADPSVIARTPLSVGSYTVANIAPNTPYSFSVQDCNDFVCTPLSNVVSYNGGPMTQPPPLTLAFVQGAKSVALTTLNASSGSFATNVTIPANSAPGDYVLVAQANGATLASTPLKIVAGNQTDPTIGFVDPTTGVVWPSTRVAVGNPVTVRGEGFAAGTVKLTTDTPNGAALASANAAGSPPVFNVTFKFNASGDHEIIATESATNLTAKAAITAQSNQ